MDDLYVRLQKALDEAERRLSSFSTRDWRAETTGNAGPAVHTDDVDKEPQWLREVNYQMWHCDDELDGCPEIAREWIAEAEHIARWDPSTVLRLIERDRELLRRHREAVLAAEAPGTSQRGWLEGQLDTLTAELERAAEFWLTDTETTDG